MTSSMPSIKSTYKKLPSSPKSVPAATMPNPIQTPHTKPTMIAIISCPKSCMSPKRVSAKLLGVKKKRRILPEGKRERS